MGKKGGGSCGGALKGKLVLEARYREGRHLRTDGNMGTQSRWKRRRHQFKGGGGAKKKGGGGGQNASVGVRRVQAPLEASEGYQDTGGSSRATKGDDSRRNQ